MSDKDDELDALLEEWMLDYGIIAGSTNQEIWQAEFNKLGCAAEVTKWHAGHCGHEPAERPRCLRMELQKMMDDIKPEHYGEFFVEFVKFTRRVRDGGQD